MKSSELHVTQVNVCNMCCKSTSSSHLENAAHHVFLHTFLAVFVQVDAQTLEDACSSCMCCVILGEKKEIHHENI